MNNNKKNFNAEEIVKTVDEKLAYYKAEIDTRTGQAKSDAKSIIDSLHDKKEDLSKKISLAKKESGNAVEDMSLGVEMAANDLSVALDSAKERLHKFL